jgi:hypothetical protein
LALAAALAAAAPLTVVSAGAGRGRNHVAPDRHTADEHRGNGADLPHAPRRVPERCNGASRRHLPLTLDASPHHGAGHFEIGVEIIDRLVRQREHPGLEWCAVIMRRGCRSNGSCGHADS